MFGDRAENFYLFCIFRCSCILLPDDRGMKDYQTWAIIGAIVLLALIARILLGRSAGPLPYFSRGSLLTDGELAFYDVLRRGLPPGVAISMKVRLADVLDCPSAARQQGYFAKISQKHLDFVLYDVATTKILAAVELDDRSHERRDRRERDAFLEQAMAVAGVPLLRVPAAAWYDARQLRDLVGSAVAA